MNKDRIYWQQAAGDWNRNYAALCIRWGVILNGPGVYGSWPESEPVLRKIGISSKKITDLKRFCSEMKPGDMVTLRLGTTTCVAVGVIEGDYEWSECFGDVDGWNLQHIRRVRWLWHSLDKPKIFPTYSFKQGDTTQQLSSNKIKVWADTLTQNIDPDFKLQTLPSAEAEVSVPEIANFLFDHGVAAESINRLTE